MISVTMTIAGSDSGGGAGIQADLKTFQELKTFGTSSITALTAQNTLGVQDVFPVEASFIVKQINAILEDFDVKAIKTGMLFSSTIIREVSNRLKDTKIPLIIDPVMIAKGGATLLQSDAIDAMVEDLFPIASIITPNIPEAEAISGISITNEEDLNKVAEKLLSFGPKVVIIKGGHLSEEKDAIDRVYFQDGRTETFTAKRLPTKDTHGTGCTFSAAITAFIARGFSIEDAISEAKKYIHAAISHGLNLGHGHGPTNHFAYNDHVKKEMVSDG